MKVFLHRIMSVVLAMVVLFSTTSFTINKHYCGKNLVDVKIYKEAEGCGMEMPMSSSISELEFTKTPCCKNEQILVQGQDELQTSIENFNVYSDYVIVSVVYTYLNLFESLPKEIIPFKDYSPPNLVTDIHVIDQVFII